MRKRALFPPFFFVFSPSLWLPSHTSKYLFLCPSRHNWAPSCWAQGGERERERKKKINQKSNKHSLPGQLHRRIGQICIKMQRICHCCQQAHYGIDVLPIVEETQMKDGCNKWCCANHCLRQTYSHNMAFRAALFFTWSERERQSSTWQSKMQGVSQGSNEGSILSWTTYFNCKR